MALSCLRPSFRARAKLELKHISEKADSFRRSCRAGLSLTPKRRYKQTLLRCCIGTNKEEAALLHTGEAEACSAHSNDTASEPAGFPLRNELLQLTYCSCIRLNRIQPRASVQTSNSRWSTPLSAEAFGEQAALICACTHKWLYSYSKAHLLPITTLESAPQI